LKPQPLAGLFVLAAAIALVIGKPKRPATPLSWGLLWAFTLYLPVSGIFVRVDDLFFEHWLYLPTMGLFLGTAESLVRHLSSVRIRYAASGAATLAAGLFGIVTLKQNEFWHDSFTLYAHILDCGEDSTKLRNNLGNAYADEGRYDLAIPQYRRAIELSDTNAEAHYNLGRAMLAVGQEPAGVSESLRHFQRALQLSPDLLPVYDELAAFYANQKDAAHEREVRAKASLLRQKLDVE
jgi:tetratricopeptide (TPR) repeat protein